jgi:cell division protein FtsQ
VTGVLILTPDEVREAAAVPAGTPLTRVDVDAVRGRVAVLPPAGEVTVSRQWPGTLLITVVERTPVAALARLDADGRPLKEFDLMDDHGVIFRTARTVPRGVVMMRLAAKAPSEQFTAASRSALAVLRTLTPQLRAELVTLVVDGPARIRLELRKDRIVTWGDAEESELKAKVATALLARPAKQIDVSAPEVVTLK